MNKATLEVVDLQPDAQIFLQEVLEGLNGEPKRLHPKWLYDEKGSQLFEQITALPEYYVTRTELAILQQYAEEMVSYMGEQAVLVDLGSGSSEKVKMLLNQANDWAAYIPVDISKEFLAQSAASLAGLYPSLKVSPVCADYTCRFELPHLEQASKKIVFFPGSTFGNFEPQDAKAFLQSMSYLLNKGDGMLIGIDLRKDPETLHRAYNDTMGVTAAFNMNMVARINRELQADFRLEQWEHYAYYNIMHYRIEMHIRSLEDQIVSIGDEQIRFQKGETIHTENSYKYDVDSFQALAAPYGFQTEKVWTDPDDLFSVIYLTLK